MHGDKKYQIDMCHGPLFSQILRFVLPLLGTNILSLLFFAADLIVLGQFAPEESRTAATAAVGTSIMLNSMLLIFFFGFSAGVCSITARYVGAKDNKKVSRTVHTSIALGLYGGIAVAVLGVIFARTFLRWISTPDDVLDKATIYMQICSIGLPFTVLYSIGAAILRAVGDTKRPLIYITIAGVVNVLLNLLFVVCFKMDAAGVALATKLSNILSAVLVLHALYRSESSIRLIFKKIRFHFATLKEVLWIGIPAGCQGALFTLSNIFIQSSVNALGRDAIAGNAASQSLEGLANVAASACSLAAMSFAGQNLGGKKYKRIIRSILISLLYTTLFSVFFCGIFLIFGNSLLGLYNPDPDVIRWGAERLVIMMSTYFLCSIMDTICGSLRGLGHSVKPTVTCILGICGIRIFWVFAIFPYFGSLRSLMISYPVSWVLTGLVNGVILIYVCHKLLKQARNEGLLYLHTHKKTA